MLWWPQEFTPLYKCKAITVRSPATGNPCDIHVNIQLVSVTHNAQWHSTFYKNKKDKLKHLIMQYIGQKHRL